jgi:dienelactone hydrolase
MTQSGVSYRPPISAPRSFAVSLLGRLLPLLLIVLAHPRASADEIKALPGAELLAGELDLSASMMDGLHRYIERKIAASVEQRAAHWRRDFSSRQAYEASIVPNRNRFATIVGAVDERLPARLERFGDDVCPALVAEMAHYAIYQVRWPVLDGVWGEGLLLEPAGAPVAAVVVLPDADQTPEQLAGLAAGVGTESQLARRLVERGCRVLAPALVDRTDEWSGSPRVFWTNQTHREWIYRQAYHMGRHVIGYEAQKVLSAVDWFRGQQGSAAKVGVAGYGEGGLIAFYAAALDPRIDVCLVSGYFDQRSRPWEEPLYRNVWSLLREFGDAEIATLIAPRGLVIEHSRAPEIAGPPAVRSGRRPAAAVGRLTTPAWSRVQAEFARMELLLPVDLRAAQLTSGAAGEPAEPFSAQTVEKFASLLSVPGPCPVSGALPVERRSKFDNRERQQRQVKQLEDHVQRLVRGAEQTRDGFFSIRVDPKQASLDQFAARIPQGRKYLWDEIFGRLEDRLLPLATRSRQIYDRPNWVGYDVVLDVYEDVFAWGILLLPKDMKPGERRPVVVCQHGRNGVPRDTIEGDHKAYHDYAARLADRGYIVFAPHNPYRGEDRYRILSRKANSVHASLFSFILAQHEQILNFLEKLPQVDPQRIAFYGLSYGGEAAVRVPPLLDRYCLSICSADFNDWDRKVAAIDAPYSFMFTVEWEMPYFDMGTKFNYAEMTSLMLPRPFMVERGHADPVAPDEWVAAEYAKVRRLYDQLGLGDQTQIEFFNGPHTINGQGTFEFLDRRLRPMAK